MQGCASSMNIYISSQNVKDVMKIFKLNKACGFDLITHTLLKESVDILYLPLSTLFDKSLSVNVFPAEWKMANVIPIYKSKDSSNITNYYPYRAFGGQNKTTYRRRKLMLNDWSHEARATLIIYLAIYSCIPPRPSDII